MDKSPDAFRTISEVAEELDLPQHVLRFWETKFTQIKPLKRGGGRRYYRPSDVDLLKGIRTLLYGEGYTIKGVQRILRSEGIRAVEAIGRGDLTIARQPVDDEKAEDALEVGEDAFSDEAQEAGHSVPDFADAAEHSPISRRHFDALQTGQLRAALDELRECKRVLDNLRRDADLEPG
jgi:DNA-binding transcriptional MerR regulator